MSNRRSQLLAATCRVIARDGLRGLRVENVAAEASTSTTLLYYYFKDRAGLITNTMAYINERVGSYDSPAEGANGYERLRTQLLCEFADDLEVRENSAVWGEVRAAAVFDVGLRPSVESATTRWISDITGLIAAGQDDGSISSAVDAPELAARITILIEGLSNRWLADLLSTDQARTHVTAMLDNELLDPQTTLTH